MGAPHSDTAIGRNDGGAGPTPVRRGLARDVLRPRPGDRGAAPRGRARGAGAPRIRDSLHIHGNQGSPRGCLGGATSARAVRRRARGDDLFARGRAASRRGIDLPLRSGPLGSPVLATTGPVAAGRRSSLSLQTDSGSGRRAAQSAPTSVRRPSPAEVRQAATPAPTTPSRGGSLARARPAPPPTRSRGAGGVGFRPGGSWSADRGRASCCRGRHRRVRECPRHVPMDRSHRTCRKVHARTIADRLREPRARPPRARPPRPGRRPPSARGPRARRCPCGRPPVR